MVVEMEAGMFCGTTLVRVYTTAAHRWCNLKRRLIGQVDSIAVAVGQSLPSVRGPVQPWPGLHANLFVDAVLSLHVAGQCR